MKQSQVRWPAEYHPSQSPVYSYNELSISAPTEHVWAWLIYAKGWPDWYSNCQNLTIESGPSSKNLSLGTQFRWKTFGVFVSTTVVEFVPNERLSWKGSGLGAHGYHSWVLKDHSEGCHVITEETQKGLIPGVMRFFLRKGLLYYHQKWLEGLSKKASSGLPPGVDVI